MRLSLARSLSTRLLTAVLATASVTLAGLVGLVVVRANQNLADQSLEVSRWSEAQVTERLRADARLAGARIRIMRRDVERRFATLAKRQDIAKAIFSGNTVASAELLKPALALADLDGAIAFDANLRALTADRVEASLLDANSAIVASPLAPLLRGLADRNDPDNPRGFVKSFLRNEPLSLALALDETGTVVDVFAQPIFDDFGDVVGELVAYRMLRAHETTLEEFARISGRDVLVLNGREVVSSAGSENAATVELRERPGSRLRALQDLGKVTLCEPVDPGLSLCAAAQAAEVDHIASKVVGIGEENSRSLLMTLVIAAGGGLALFGFVSVALANRIARPLASITRTCAEVARGDWRVAVPHVGRTDEVGNIARAVVLLEKSLEERDQLREHAIDQNETLAARGRQLNEQNERFDAALNNMSQGLCMFDAERRLSVFNGRLLKIYGLAPEAVHGGMTVEEVRRLMSMPERALAPSLVGEGTAGRPRTIHLESGRTVEVSVRPMLDGGWVETHEDVTEVHSAQARISYLATHDTVTSLPNRVLFADRLAEAFVERQRTGAEIAVLSLDLDDFKGVNDTLGHAAGDALLEAVGRRLAEVATEAYVVARLGGDEFAILLCEGPQPGHALALAERVLARLKQPYLIAGQVVVTGASVGVAVTQIGDDDADGLLRRADLALYAAKQEGRGRWRLFEPVMEERLHHRRWLEADLREAIRTDGIDVFYQPLFSLDTNQISGFEALARWRHPERGQVSPGEFIPIAETSGLIDGLGECVLRKACREAMGWQVAVPVSVNVSPIQFRNPDLFETIRRTLEETGLPANRLELEITESVILRHDEDIHETLHRLRRLGVRFAMDDFGTGYSSLSTLNSFRFDKIKLDQSFVRDLTTRTESAAIVRIVADLGRGLNVRTTAEGVETPQQLQRLRASGFSEAQGYLFSPAVPADEVAALLTRVNELRSAA